MQRDFLASLAPSKMTKPLAVSLGHREAQPAADVLADQAERRASALYHESAAEFRRYALLLSKDEELARDALQEAFMRYFVALCNGKQITNARAWIYRVMRNYLLDRMKAYRARDERSIEELSSCPGTDQDVEASYYRREVLRLIQETLTPRERECVRLRGAGLRYDEIATALRVRSGTVGALISRAMRKMRLALGKADQLPFQAGST
ncbi:MAG: sigma-70 family RNA polymerase sigma factor [Luteitalea sp.]|nr:sigma-70 family RNA polymerase sigma factor [Luteitalea sp.]